MAFPRASDPAAPAWAPSRGSCQADRSCLRRVGGGALAVRCGEERPACGVFNLVSSALTSSVLYFFF